MYHCKLNIVILSNEPFLQEVVSSIKPLKRFEHNIIAYKRFSEKAFASGDIIIIDLPAHKNIRKLRALCKEGAVMVLCTSAEDILALDEAELALADEYWETPLNKALIAHRFKKLLGGIKLGRDYHLSETYLEGVINTIPDMVWFKNKEGIHLKVNKVFCGVAGRAMEDVTGQDHCDIWNVDTADIESGEVDCISSEQIVIQQKETCQFIEKVKSQRGMRQLRAYKTPLFDENGEVMGTVGVGRDITDFKNLGVELEVFICSMPFAILVWNEKGIITNANDKFEKYFNTRKQDIIGQHYGKWVQSAFDGEVAPNDDGTTEAKFYTQDQSSSTMLELHEECIYNVFNNIVGHFCIYRDITAEQEMKKQILKSSNTDFMTGLYNRRYLYQYINSSRGVQAMSMLSIDLDNFKKINDTNGHHVGDKALVLFANILCKCFPHGVVARVGGDEFLVAIIGEYSIEALKVMAQRLIDTMRTTFEDFPQLSILSASIGIAQTSDASLNMDMLMQQSDTALYVAKRNGKARYFVYCEDME